MSMSNAIILVRASAHLSSPVMLQVSPAPPQEGLINPATVRSAQKIFGSTNTLIVSYSVDSEEIAGNERARIQETVVSGDSKLQVLATA